MAFPTLEKKEEQAVIQKELTDEEKKKLVDDYPVNGTLHSYKHAAFIDTKLSKCGIKKMEEIYKYVLSLCSGKVVVTVASIDDEGVETPATYKEVPSTLDALKTQSHEEYSDCGKETFDYLIDKIIVDSTEAGTYESFISVLNS